jgi:hypothetical protein
MSNPALDELKRQIPLLDYLQAQDWRPAATPPASYRPIPIASATLSPRT